MSKPTLSDGTVHKIPADLKKSLATSPEVVALWESLTTLARNEWICWVEAVKRPEKRLEHIERVTVHLLEGKRRPCCWIGCVHRTDKPMSRSQKFILGKKSQKK